MTGVLFFHAHHRHSIRAAFRRKVEIDDLGKLLLQDWDEHLVECDPQYGRFIGRSTGIGAVIDRRRPGSDPINGKYGKCLDLVVVASVVSEWTFWCFITGLYGTFEHHFRTGRNFEVGADTVNQLGFGTSEQTRKGVLGECIGHWRHGAEHGCRVRAQCHHDRESLTGMTLLPLAEVECSTAVGQPAHDDSIAADHLLAINT